MGSPLLSSINGACEQTASRFEPRVMGVEARERCSRAIFLDFDGVLHLNRPGIRGGCLV